MASVPVLVIVIADIRKPRCLIWTDREALFENMAKKVRWMEAQARIYLSESINVSMVDEQTD